MSLFKKLKKKIKYSVKVYDGTQWIEVAVGKANTKEDIEKDIESMKSAGVVPRDMAYKVEDNKGSVILMYTPSKTNDDEFDDARYRVEYRTGTSGRWSVFEEYDEEPDGDIIDAIIDSGSLPPGSEIRVVKIVKGKKRVLYKSTIPGVSNVDAVVASTGDNLIINVNAIKQIKSAVSALRQVRDEINEVLGEGKQPIGTNNVNPDYYEGKPPWWLRPDVTGPIIQAVLGNMVGNNLMSNNKQSNNNNMDELDDYLE